MTPKWQLADFRNGSRIAYNPLLPWPALFDHTIHYGEVPN